VDVLLAYDVHVASDHILDILMDGIQLLHLRLVVVKGCIVETPLLTHSLDILATLMILAHSSSHVGDVLA